MPSLGKGQKVIDQALRLNIGRRGSGNSTSLRQQRALRRTLKEAGPLTSPLHTPYQDSPLSPTIAQTQRPQFDLNINLIQDTYFETRADWDAKVAKRDAEQHHESAAMGDKFSQYGIVAGTVGTAGLFLQRIYPEKEAHLDAVANHPLYNTDVSTYDPFAAFYGQMAETHLTHTSFESIRENPYLGEVFRDGGEKFMGMENAGKVILSLAFTYIHVGHKGFISALDSWCKVTFGEETPKFIVDQMNKVKKDGSRTALVTLLGIVAPLCFAVALAKNTSQSAKDFIKDPNFIAKSRLRFNAKISTILHNEILESEPLTDPDGHVIRESELELWKSMRLSEFWNGEITFEEAKHSFAQGDSKKTREFYQYFFSLNTILFFSQLNTCSNASAAAGMSGKAFYTSVEKASKAMAGFFWDLKMYRVGVGLLALAHLSIFKATDSLFSGLVPKTIRIMNDPRNSSLMGEHMVGLGIYGGKAVQSLWTLFAIGGIGTLFAYTTGHGIEAKELYDELYQAGKQLPWFVEWPTKVLMVGPQVWAGYYKAKYLKKASVDFAKDLGKIFKESDSPVSGLAASASFAFMPSPGQSMDNFTSRDHFVNHSIGIFNTVFSVIGAYYMADFSTFAIAWQLNAYAACFGVGQVAHKYKNEIRNGARDRIIGRVQKFKKRWTKARQKGSFFQSISTFLMGDGQGQQNQDQQQPDDYEEYGGIQSGYAMPLGPQTTQLLVVTQ